MVGGVMAGRVVAGADWMGVVGAVGRVDRVGMVSVCWAWWVCVAVEKGRCSRVATRVSGDVAVWGAGTGGWFPTVQIPYHASCMYVLLRDRAPGAAHS